MDTCRIERKIGEGGFGSVYLISWRERKYALKVERNRERMRNEISVLRRLNHPSIPRILAYGMLAECAYFIMPLLHVTLLQLWVERRGYFSARRVAMIGLCLVETLSYVHSMGYVYRDLKPENIMIGHDSKVYLVDFGMCVRCDGERRNVFVGTIRYAPLSAHDGASYEAKDDLESLWYVLLFLAKGGLPWMRIEQQGRREVGAMKREMSLEEMTLGVGSRGEWIRFMRHLRGLGRADAPDYSYLKACIFGIAGRDGGAGASEKPGGGRRSLLHGCFWCCR